MTVYILKYNDGYNDSIDTIGAFDSMERAEEYRDKMLGHTKLGYLYKDWFDISPCKVNPCFETEFGV